MCGVRDPGEKKVTAMIYRKILWRGHRLAVKGVIFLCFSLATCARAAILILIEGHL